MATLQLRMLWCHRLMSLPTGGRDLVIWLVLFCNILSSINALRPSAAYIFHQPRPSLVQIMAWRQAIIIFNQENAFENSIWKMSDTFPWPQCVKSICSERIYWKLWQSEKLCKMMCNFVLCLLMAEHPQGCFGIWNLTSISCNINITFSGLGRMCSDEFCLLCLTLLSVVKLLNILSDFLNDVIWSTEYFHESIYSQRNFNVNLSKLWSAPCLLIP